MKTKILLPVLLLLLCAATGAQTLDPTFGPVLAGRSGRVTYIFKRADGKLVMLGDFRVIGSLRRDVVAVVNTDYTVDASFNPGEISSGQSTLYANIGAAQTDGKILIAGYFGQINGVSVPDLVRLNLDGSVDSTFNVGPDSMGIRAIKVLPDGKILIAGYISTIQGQPVPPIVRLNPDGSRDQTFNAVINGFPPIDTIIVQPDGKLIVTGEIYSIPSGQPLGILRLNENGSIDNSFNSGTGPNAFIDQTVLLPDGKILISGPFNTFNQVERWGLARLNSNGSLDTTFVANTFLSDFNYEINLVPLANGQTIVAGAFDAVNGVSRRGIARLNMDGSVDTSYAPALNQNLTSGNIDTVFLLPDEETIVTGNFNTLNQQVRLGIAKLNYDGSTDPDLLPVAKTLGGVNALHRQPDGKILLGGLFSTLNGSMHYGIARVNDDGSVDSSFSSGNGLLDVTPGGSSSSDYVRALAGQSDGKFIAGGSFRAYNNSLRPDYVRILSNGSLDLTFSNTGSTSIDAVTDIAIQADGRIVMSCISCSKGVLRRNIDGTVDTGFIPGSGANGNVNAVVIQPDGKIVIAGQFTSVSGVPRNRIARLTVDGALDLTFDPGSGANGIISDVALQTDGKIVAAGSFTSLSAITRNRVGRFNSDGSVDAGFDPGAGANNQVNTISIDPDGRIFIGGSFDSFNGVPRSRIARLRSNGSLDSSFGSAIDIAHPGMTASVNAISQTPSGLVVGGYFSKVNGQPKSGIARFQLSHGSRPFDFDGDGKTDIGIFRPIPGTAEWWINRSGNGQTFALQFGSSTDRIAPADYTGDGKTDIAFFRPSSGEWYVLRSEDFSFFALPFGANGDIPVPADYDADGKADFAVYRPSSSTWFISQSSGAPTRIEGFGIAGDQPVVADYDGDNKADVGIFRNNAGVAEWWINRSTAGVLAMQFGAGTDKAVQGDYTGDGKADIAIWRPADGNWLIVRSEDFSFFGFPFGANGDVPSPGDYDGDGKFDPTVFRPSSATWFSGRTTAGTLIVQFGATGDRPIPNAFVP